MKSKQWLNIYPLIVGSCKLSVNKLNQKLIYFWRVLKVPPKFYVKCVFLCNCIDSLNFINILSMHFVMFQCAVSISLTLNVQRPKLMSHTRLVPKEVDDA